MRFINSYNRLIVVFSTSESLWWWHLTKYCCDIDNLPDIRYTISPIKHFTENTHISKNKWIVPLILSDTVQSNWQEMDEKWWYSGASRATRCLAELQSCISWAEVWEQTTANWSYKNVPDSSYKSLFTENSVATQKHMYRKINLSCLLLRSQLGRSVAK